ncbi:MAG: oxidoreductase, partial [Boseongicola sp.]|nr:oxidoreductase [Boseongicola sp.]
KWWWDLEIDDKGAYRPTPHPVNARDLQTDLDLRYEDQTLAVYPAPLAPPPWPYPFPMDREAGIEAYRAMVPPEVYKDRLAKGATDGLAHAVADHSDSPVLPVVVSKVEAMTSEVTLYEFRDPNGGDLPEWTAGAHLDIVVAPEFLRQFSMSGDPADRSKYQIGVLREEGGRGGSRLMHRIFTEGRRVFISKPINHFPLDETATRTILMGGGIGITPMIAMAHRLDAIGADFVLHYSVKSRASAGYLDHLAQPPWSDRVTVHVSDEGTRADPARILSGYRDGWHVYTCGPDRFMKAVLDAAEKHGFPDPARHLEYFSVPDLPEYQNHPFTLRLARSDRDIPVAADESATDALARNGIAVDVKCSDGLCGVCKCGLVSGAIEHRDFVLSNAQRATSLILCQSRAARPGGIVEIDL